MTTAKYILYAIVVLAFLVAGGLDLYAGEYKVGAIAIGFGLLNGLIFLVR